MISTEASQLGHEAAHRLARLGRVAISAGLTDAEFDRIEQTYGFEFADDHRAFLAAGLPLNAPPDSGQARKNLWPDWRNGDPNDLSEQLARPIEDALFDIEMNGVWRPAWGKRPTDPKCAVEMARPYFEQAPKLVPIRGHRFLPAGHGTYGHPVLSVHQTDIIFYGTDLADYIDQEFGSWNISEDWEPPPLVPFWSDFV
ncbi:hypothetical protein [Actinomadura sp. K4S16]|uniref:hypothetical protein n=1 Tax=Actinomadura sp. K4S16 TaxID=1316147 RepID=UPI0011EFB509|nr:hypothetical protein [Actinomadura sp. K4S16]